MRVKRLEKLAIFALAKSRLGAALFRFSGTKAQRANNAQISGDPFRLFGHT
jgi:hypothetical protein